MMIMTRNKTKKKTRSKTTIVQAFDRILTKRCFAGVRQCRLRFADDDRHLSMKSLKFIELNAACDVRCQHKIFALIFDFIYCGCNDTVLIYLNESTRCKH